MLHPKNTKQKRCTSNCPYSVFISYLAIPQIQITTNDLLHFFNDNRLAGCGGKVLQRSLVSGLGGLGKITFRNKLLLYLGAAALGCVLHGPFGQSGRGIPLQGCPNIDLADAVFKQLADLIIGNRGSTV